MVTLAEFAKALASYLNITRRSAWAILIGAIACAASLTTSSYWPIPIWISVAATIIAFTATLVVYHPNKWEAWRRRRKQQALGVEALDHLNKIESACVLYIYHSGGTVRSGSNKFIAELERLHILGEADPLSAAQYRIYRLAKAVQKTLSKQIGPPVREKATGQPPWYY